MDIVWPDVQPLTTSFWIELKHVEVISLKEGHLQCFRPLCQMICTFLYRAPLSIPTALHSSRHITTGRCRGVQRTQTAEVHHPGRSKLRCQLHCSKLLAINI